jgi:RNA polymerase sigma-54 factor
MQINQNFDIKQSQNLSMSPQLQQAIKLLQMTNLELTAFMEEQFNNNPLLDMVNALELDRRNNTVNDTQENKEFSELKNSEMISENSFSDYASDKMPTIAENEFSNIGNYKNLNNSTDFSEDDSSQHFSQAPDLRQYLSNQLYMSHAPQEIMMIASYLIGSLSDTGYLHESCSEIAAQLMEPVKKIEEALALCQQFEPAGIFARTLGECLRLQLIDKKIFNKKYDILLNNLDDLANNRYVSLLSKLNVTKPELANMITHIKKLHPKPGLQFSNEPIISVIPDVFIYETNNGGWHVMLNHATMPKAIINQNYSMYLSKDNKNKIEKNTKRYLKESYHQASWLIKSLEQRSDTILRVATEILRQQDGFFAYGFEHLRPMNLKLVAEELGLHESTVSRVTSGKYLGCPRGIFEMKFFFMSGITGNDGEASVASQSVKYEIKKMIDSENPKAILSDDDIVEKLQQKEISIARRTVAKYREAMNIPSSVKRRRSKNSYFDEQ